MLERVREDKRFSRSHSQDSFTRLANDVGEDIKTTTVWHTNDGRLDAVFNGAVNECLHTGNERFAALETESLLVREFGSDEALERVRPDESVEDHSLLLERVVPRLWRLDSVSNPITLVLFRDVDVLRADWTAVDLLARVVDLTQSHLRLSSVREALQDTRTEVELLGVEVRLRPAVVSELQLGRDVLLSLWLDDAEWISLSENVATDLERSDEELHLEVVCEAI